ncbi:amino acid/amide ABC transporter ATP-binding protein 2, HAAT family [Faunimonas pinastri]|uniref:Amino acid/amide ABC transporter ATP-binding protein 2, HAAT family n=1 Tax=Faunimonas pinastri TaxID=1855383 RepID=A0A1H9E4W7_9HYPH|nr:ABC transporter ATP-binding protein [Faunimonas pinastri]SEQ20283.1 amino acid/amide ABC transporter ATP-binding protein 2, HAAT family [Faunimonas pinastri]
MSLLEVDAIDTFYGDFQALYGISMAVDEGQVVAVIGANGAGKSTLMKSIVGLLHPARGRILLDGRPVEGMRPSKLVAQGIALVPEGRRLFPSLSVGENLMVAGQLGRPGPWTIERVFDLFPVLRERQHQQSTSLSGGQQQMVAIGRALMSNPRLLLCDELSLGLAPIVVREIFGRLPEIVAQGTSIVIVEQDVMQAMAAASMLYCLQEGRTVLSGPPKSLTADTVRAAYFGV